MDKIKTAKQQPSNKATTTKKLCYIDAVIRARTTLISEDAKWVENRRAELTTASETDHSASTYETQRDIELSLPFNSRGPTLYVSMSSKSTASRRLQQQQQQHQVRQIGTSSHRTQQHLVRRLVVITSVGTSGHKIQRHGRSRSVIKNKADR
jgi:hypothetical protein